jgi:ribA/ribD-fused uncharacterized protein
MEEKIIDDFRGANEACSNFFTTKVVYEDMTFDNSEAAFQAAKSLDREVRERFQHLIGRDAKALGRKIALRPNWESIKNKVMLDIVYEKFSGNKNLGDYLISTGNAILIEGNTWGDKYWGVCRGVGTNMLGRILMTVRARLIIDRNPQKAAYQRIRLKC